MGERGLRLKGLWVAIVGSALIASHYAIFSRFFPARNGNIGSDYGYFLPHLLDGYFWYQRNGIFAVPWHTPSFCGGLPKFPNPQASYYSVPQFFTFFTDPLTSLTLTLIVFATLGFWGFYFLLRRSFLLGTPAAFLGATLFLFNGLYAYRLIIGHLTFHSFMLFPIICLFVLRPYRSVEAGRRWVFCRDAVCAGLLLAYMAVTGVAHVLLQSLAAVLVVGFISALLRGTAFSIRQFALKLAAASFCALCVSAAKLTAITAHLSEFPRRLYPLPGVSDFSELVLMFANALFWTPKEALTTDAIANSRWLLTRPEFEFGVTCVPALILTAAVVANFRTWGSGDFLRRVRRDQWAYVGLCALILSLPIGFNYYTPAWNEFLKSLPVLSSSITLLRWISVYIPVTILLAAIAAERLESRFRRPALFSGAGIVAVIALNAATDRELYHESIYSPRPVVEAYQKVRAGEWRPSITRIAVSVDRQGRMTMPQERNDSLTEGASQLLCYEPLFGFRMEVFPSRALRPGPALQASSGVLNVNHPACFAFPAENGCVPGEHFRIDQNETAEAFLRYEPIAFALPVYQTLANALSLLSLSGAAVFLVACGVRWWSSDPTKSR